jgi:hypothetical protein
MQSRNAKQDLFYSLLITDARHRGMKSRAGVKDGMSVQASAKKTLKRLTKRSEQHRQQQRRWTWLKIFRRGASRGQEKGKL